MKSFLLIALIAVPATAFGVEDPAKFEAYKQRRASRHAYALDARRAINATRGPAVYRTAIAVKAPMTMLVGVQQGWIMQPPIPMRPIVAVGIASPVYPMPYVAPTRPSPVTVPVASVRAMMANR
jgi:hypothetical protein